MLSQRCYEGKALPRDCKGQRRLDIREAAPARKSSDIQWQHAGRGVQHAPKSSKQQSTVLRLGHVAATDLRQNATMRVSAAMLALAHRCAGNISGCTLLNRHTLK